MALMSPPQRQAWKILVALTVIQLFMFGPTSGTMGVFILPFIKEFGWSHEQASRIATAYALAMGASALCSGWLLDHISARWVVALGIISAAVGCLLGSHVHALTPLVLCYAMMGVGASFAAWVPIYVLGTSWFPNRRALAIGIAGMGVAIGMALAPRILTTIIAHAGWRVAMRAVAVPMLLVALPIDLLLISGRPAGQIASRARPAQELPGLDLGPALRTSAYWLVVAVAFFSALGQGAGYVHAIPFLVGSGYTAGAAASIFGIQAFLSGVGMILAGALADRYGPKLMTAVTLALLAVGLLSILAVRDPHWRLTATLTYIILWGLDMGYRGVLPVLMLEALGPRRFATLSGGFSCADALGHASGPIVAGLLFDLTRSYTLAFELAGGVILLSALLSAMVFPAKWRNAAPPSVDLAAGTG